TKSAAHYTLTLEPGQSQTLRLRLSTRDPGENVEPFGAGFDQIVEDRKREADEFYRAITPPSLSEDAARVIRQGYAGLLWTKQAYVYDVDRWLTEKGVTRDSRGNGVRNQHWFHM